MVGLSLAARQPVLRPYRGAPPRSTRDRESYTLFIVHGLQRIAADPLAFGVPPAAARLVAGQAAGHALLPAATTRGAQARRAGGVCVYTVRDGALEIAF